MKIAMIGQKGIPATFGGVEYHVDRLSRGLAALGHEVTVYARRWYSPAGSSPPPGVHRAFVPTIRTKHLDATVHSLICSFRAVIDGADIVHYHAIGPGLFSPIPRLFGKRVVTTIHRLDWAAEKWTRPAKAVLKSAEALATVVPHARIVVSRGLQDYLRARYGAASVFIPQGTVVPVFRSPRIIREKYGLAGNDYVLFMGRLSPEKRVDWLLRAFRSLGAAGTPERAVKLVIAGGSSATGGYVGELVRSAQGSPDIVFTGNVTGAEKDELLSNALLFVLPSSVEGYPIVLLEARNHGRACLASDISPHREVIREDVDGALFRSTDPNDLAAKLAALLSDRARIGRYGESARTRSTSNASWEEVARRTLDVYRSVLFMRGSRGGREKSSRPAR